LPAIALDRNAAFASAAAWRFESAKALAAVVSASADSACLTMAAMPDILVRALAAGIVVAFLVAMMILPLIEHLVTSYKSQVELLLNHKHLTM
jgi:membrane protein YdbS with pleckstrin-like domain